MRDGMKLDAELVPSTCQVPHEFSPHTFIQLSDFIPMFCFIPNP